jgi:hypothetical protein
MNGRACPKIAGQNPFGGFLEIKKRPDAKPSHQARQKRKQDHHNEGKQEPFLKNAF